MNIGVKSKYVEMAEETLVGGRLHLDHSKFLDHTPQVPIFPNLLNHDRATEERICQPVIDLLDAHRPHPSAQHSMVHFRSCFSVFSCTLQSARWTLVLVVMRLVEVARRSERPEREDVVVVGGPK